MVTSAPKLESTEDVIKHIPDNDFEFYNYLDKDEIRNGHICDCETPKKQNKTPFYTIDKTAIDKCDECGGFFSLVLNNW